MDTALKYPDRIKSNETWNMLKLRLSGIKNDFDKKSPDSEFSFAFSFCYQVIKNLWEFIDKEKIFELRHVDFNKVDIGINAYKLAKDMSKFFASLSLVECGYYIGGIYTSLLSEKYKAGLGIYYTPPIVAERLLDILASQGVNWSKDKILDPACGGGAFLVPVTNRILGDYRIKCLSEQERLFHMENHLFGLEIDEFAGWITQVLIDIIMYPEAVATGRLMKRVILTANTMDHALKNDEKFDLIVGNPPYGRITLSKDLREAYSRSLFGHANMYGVFIDAALRFRSERGLVGFVLPTSFLGGEYFKNLRKLLLQEAPPICIDFISARAGVFDEVLQETCLTVFGTNQQKGILINKIDVDESGYTLDRIGAFKASSSNKPWIIPRENSEIEIVRAVNNCTTFIGDYGYKVSTGPLVWNRHKEQLRENYETDTYPIVWAEAVKEGRFSLDYKNRKIKFIRIGGKQEFLLCRKPVVLVNRTTAKEQAKRIISTLMPESYIEEWNGVVIENHVNMIFPVGNEKLSLDAISIILNTTVVDRIFRCISGSVAVSASELHSLPLPSYKKVLDVEDVVREHKSGNLSYGRALKEVDEIIMRAYGIEV